MTDGKRAVLDAMARVALASAGTGRSFFRPAADILENTLARPQGLEPRTPRFEAWYSIQLSYGRG